MVYEIIIAKTLNNNCTLMYEKLIALAQLSVRIIKIFWVCFDLLSIELWKLTLMIYNWCQNVLYGQNIANKLSFEWIEYWFSTFKNKGVDDVEIFYKR